VLGPAFAIALLVGETACAASTPSAADGETANQGTGCPAPRAAPLAMIKVTNSLIERINCPMRRQQIGVPVRAYNLCGTPKKMEK
jgi:hypothetical protein